MNIGSYTFAEFTQLAANFHGYAAPGLLLGGFMVELGKSRLPEGTLFEAVVETSKCLPDAVQLLTLCSVGNNWLKIHNLGRYALTLFDKFSGDGVRVSVDSTKLSQWPEIESWLLKRKPKAEQDEARLLYEIEHAGDSLCKVETVSMKRRFMGHAHMDGVGICPLCREPYPVDDGAVCRGCQGDAPYVTVGRVIPELLCGQSEAETPSARPILVVPLDEAVGKIAAHDMTRIEPGQFKGAEFIAGQRISVGDICRLQQMGRFHVAIQGDAVPASDFLSANVHENDAAIRFAAAMSGEGVRYDLPPREGKIDFVAATDGLFCSDTERLYAFNLVPQVMAAARQDATLVHAGDKLAGTRAIPLYLSRELLHQGLDILRSGPLFRVLPLRSARIGVLVTGTEVFQGIIEDKFVPLITAKARQYGSRVVCSVIAPDDPAQLAAAIQTILNSGADMLITTGGLSVDPDDLTRQALLNAGLRDVLHGAPVLPGTMSLLGTLDAGSRPVQVIGVPACALYYKTTFLDLMLPRLLAGRAVTRHEIARIGDGGLCLNCKRCTYPKCSYGK